MINALGRWRPRHRPRCRLLSLACVVLMLLSVTAQGQVQIEGLSVEYADNVRAFLSLETLAPDAPASTVNRALARAPEEIRTALQPFGFYSPIIQHRSKRADSDTSWQIKFDIATGPETLIAELNLTVLGAGHALSGVQQLLAEPPLQIGDHLNHAGYRAFKNEFLDRVYREGFLDAKFSTASLVVTPADHSAEITLELDSGERYYFGDITIDQQVLDPQFVARFVQISHGETFQPDRLIDLQLALSGGDYFSNVLVDVDRDDVKDYHLPVQVQAEPSPARRYTTSVGFGTDTGPRTNLGALFRRVNRRGHQASVDLQLSAIKNRVGMEYGIPIKNIAADRFTFFASGEQGDVGGADTDQYQLGVRREDDWGVFRRDTYLTFSHEIFSFGDQPEATADLLTPGLRLSYQTADNAIFTRRGYSLSFDVHGGVEGALSETSFLRGSAKANVVLPLGSRARLLLRGELGFVAADDFQSLPPSQRFFTGGDRTVRGYGFEALSPENEFGDEIGGEYLSVFGIETDVAVYRDIYLAGFFDIGGAGDSLGDRLESSVGIGFRYRTPVGMVRLDVAHPLDDPDNDFRIHVTFGPDL